MSVEPCRNDKQVKHEPSIVVNGVLLTPEQARATRMAVNALIMDIGGRLRECQCAMCDRYRAQRDSDLVRLSEVVGLMEVRHDRESA
jgi:hypothetical protein